MSVPRSECQKGIIRELQGEKALVALSGAGHCQGCVSERICHPLGGEEVKILCRNPQKLEVGTAVRIAYSSRPQLRASVLLFGLPVVGLIVGAAVADRLAASLPVQIAAAVLGALCTYLPGFLLEKKASRKEENWLPTIFVD